VWGTATCRGTARATGLSLLELLVALLLTMLVGAALLPALGQLTTTSRMAAAARLLVVQLQGLRASSVARGRSHGLFFQHDERGWYWLVVQDGNGNGLRTVEVEQGTDPVLSGPHRISDSLPHVDFGFPPHRTVPRIPPRRGALADLDRPVRLGNSGLLAYSPLGTSSSGTLFLSDGRESLIAVVLYGRTGRIRVWRLDRVRRRWSLS
jgi:Tfp pilus assembly protein FimT